MSLDNIVSIAEKILLVPPFYSDGESQLSIAASLFAALIGAVIGRRVIRHSRSILLTSALIAVLVAAFLLHWFYLYDKGGVFHWQLLCRVVFFLLFGALMLSFGKAEEDEDTP